MDDVECGMDLKVLTPFLTLRLEQQNQQHLRRHAKRLSDKFKCETQKDIVNLGEYTHPDNLNISSPSDQSHKCTIFRPLSAIILCCAVCQVFNKCLM